MKTVTSDTAFALRGILTKNAFQTVSTSLQALQGVEVSLITSVNVLDIIRKQVQASIVATEIFVTCDPLPRSAALCVSHWVSFQSEVSQHGHSFKPFHSATTSF